MIMEYQENNKFFNYLSQANHLNLEQKIALK